MKKMKHGQLIIFSLIFLFVATGIAFADTWYVSDSTGSDSNPGTETEPFATIIQAVESANNGDTILVEEGTYSGDIVITNDGLTVRSLEGASGTIISGVNTGFRLSTGNGLTIQGFRIENSDVGIQIESLQTNDVRLLNNWIENYTSDGISFAGSNINGCSIRIEQNTIIEGNYGIYFDGDIGNTENVNVQIMNNTILSSDRNGIYFPALSRGSLEISDNDFLNCAQGIEISGTSDIGLETSCKVENNEITLTGSSSVYGIYIDYTERTTWIRNNVISGDYYQGIYLDRIGYQGAEPALLYVDNNQITGCYEGMEMVNLFEDFGGEIYIRDNTVSDCSHNGMFLRNIGNAFGADDFSIFLENNVIFGCANDGLSFETLFADSTGELYIRRNSFLDNDYGLYINQENYLENSTFVAENNNFENNDFGFYNGTNITVSALDNWWGDDTGPLDPFDPNGDPTYDNPGGLGDAVSEYVDYDPWRDSPYIAGEESSGGCSTGGFDPSLIFLILPLLGLFSLKRNR